jgi:hypothetical protein
MLVFIGELRAAIRTYCGSCTFQFVSNNYAKAFGSFGCIYLVHPI